MTEYKLKDISETIEAKDKESDKKVEYKIEYKNKDGKDKMEVKDGKGTATVKAKIKKKTEGKDNEEDLGEKDVEISYDESAWLVHRGKIVKVADKEVKEGKTAGFSGIGSFAWGFWILMLVILLILGGLIWWWIASSKKEDKEEESL